MQKNYEFRSRILIVLLAGGVLAILQWCLPAKAAPAGYPTDRGLVLQFYLPGEHWRATEAMERATVANVET